MELCECGHKISDKGICAKCWQGEYKGPYETIEDQAEEIKYLKSKVGRLIVEQQMDAVAILGLRGSIEGLNIRINILELESTEEGKTINNFPPRDWRVE